MACGTPKEHPMLVSVRLRPAVAPEHYSIRRRPQRLSISSHRPQPQPVFFLIPMLLRQLAKNVPS